MRAYVARALGSAGGVLVVDETGFLKKDVRFELAYYLCCAPAGTAETGSSP